MTKTITKEWGSFGVRCNAVAFGLIDTRLTQSKEKGEFVEVEGKKVNKQTNHFFLNFKLNFNKSIINN